MERGEVLLELIIKKYIYFNSLTTFRNLTWKGFQILMRLIFLQSLMWKRYKEIISA